MEGKAAVLCQVTCASMQKASGTATQDETQSSLLHSVVYKAQQRVDSLTVGEAWQHLWLGLAGHAGRAAMMSQGV